MILKSVLSHHRRRDHQFGYIAQYLEGISDKPTGLASIWWTAIENLAIRPSYAVILVTPWL
jgi:hypothetical protein